ncbi:hypothetical protein X743_31695 [Mesorhizobium sp. LNHC252B00]|nr:hypothetical protein X743_31695 [Mesorhizobium sp. LNHC252B00]
MTGAHPSHASCAGKGEWSDFWANVRQNDNAPHWIADSGGFGIGGGFEIAGQIALARRAPRKESRR